MALLKEDQRTVLRKTTDSEALLLDTADHLIRALESDPTVTYCVTELLRATGATEADIDHATRATLREFLSILRESGVLVESLAACTQDVTVGRYAAIRTFFLQPKTFYSLGELAHLWRAPLRDVVTIFAGDAEAWHRYNGDIPVEYMRVVWHEAFAATVAFNVFSARDLEVALGRDFFDVFPHDCRTVPVLLRMPLWAVDELSTEPMIDEDASLPRRIEHVLLLHLGSETVGEAS